MKKIFTLIAVGVCWAAGVSAQGFIDLDFEQCGNVDPSVMFMSWSVAAPGWQNAAAASPFVLHNQLDPDITSFYYLSDASSPDGWRPLAGNNSLAFANGHYSSVDPQSPFLQTWIAQQGTIPSNSLSFQMLATGNFSVSVNGTLIPMTNLGSNEYGGDISAYAGQFVALKIQNESTLVHDPVIVDNLGFFPTQVPEPSSVAIISIGGVALYAGARRRRRKL